MKATQVCINGEHDRCRMTDCVCPCHAAALHARISELEAENRRLQKQTLLDLVTENEGLKTALEKVAAFGCYRQRWEQTCASTRTGPCWACIASAALTDLRGDER